MLDLCLRRGELVETTFLTPERAEVHYVLPLAEIVFDFFDQPKSSTRGYASLDHSRGVTRSPTWSASTCCCTASPWTRSARSCIARSRTPTGRR